MCDILSPDSVLAHRIIGGKFLQDVLDRYRDILQRSSCGDTYGIELVLLNHKAEEFRVGYIEAVNRSLHAQPRGVGIGELRLVMDIVLEYLPGDCQPLPGLRQVEYDGADSLPQIAVIAELELDIIACFPVLEPFLNLRMFIFNRKFGGLTLKLLTIKISKIPAQHASFGISIWSGASLLIGFNSSKITPNLFS